MGLLAGPLLQLILVGAGVAVDQWSPATQTLLMLVGIGAGAASCLLQLAMDQRLTLDGASEALQVQAPPVSPSPPRVSDPLPLTTGTLDSESSEGSGGLTAAAPPAAAATAAPPAAAATAATTATTERGAATIRWTIFSYDLIRVIAGGVAVKYVGTFFVQASHVIAWELV